jgi:hypothetical protein
MRIADDVDNLALRWHFSIPPFKILLEKWILTDVDLPAGKHLARPL